MWSWLGGGAASSAKEPDRDKVVIPTARTLTTGNTSPNASRSSSTASFKRPESEKSPVVYVTDRICAFVFEEDPSTWKEAFHLSTLSDRYKGVLHAASESIADSYGTSSGILALNLGPAWSNSEAYALFGDNVIEISFKEWESPPGLGICPLDVIFSVCYSISSWLNLNDDHVVVLHTRSCSGTGMSFVRFLAACYLTFNMDCLTVAKALETLPALPLLHQSTLAPGVGSGASQGELTRLGEATGLPAMVGATSVKVQHFASTRYVGPAQQRYGEYFCGVLFNPTLRPPSEITKMLRRIVFSRFDFVTLAAADPTLDGVWDSDDPAPFLVVYQHSKSVWAGPSETHEGLVPFNIGVPVVGDITIGVWFGHHNLGQRLHGRPALSYAFHTAFLSAETMRVSLPSLDVSNKRLFPVDKATNFFMDVTLEDTEGPPSAEMEGQIEEGDLVRLKSKWQETMAKIHGASPAPRAAPEKSEGMDNVLEELRDNKSFKKGSRPVKPAGPEDTAIDASSPSHTHAETVPDRDGSASASTSDSDDIHGHAALAKAVARYKLTPAEAGNSVVPSLKLPLQDMAAKQRSPAQVESARTIQSPQQSQSFREARTALQHHLENRASSDSAGSATGSHNSDYEASVESGSHPSSSSGASHRALKLSPSEIQRNKTRQQLADRQRSFKQKQSFSHLRPASESDWDTASISTLSDESQANMPGPHTPVPHPRAALSPAANGHPAQDRTSSPDAASTSTLFSYRPSQESAYPRVIVNITVVNDLPPVPGNLSQPQAMPSYLQQNQLAAVAASGAEVPQANGDVDSTAMPASPFASASSQEAEAMTTEALNTNAEPAAFSPPNTAGGSIAKGVPSPSVSRELFPVAEQALPAPKAASDSMQAAQAEVEVAKRAQQLPAAQHLATNDVEDRHFQPIPDVLQEAAEQGHALPPQQDQKLEAASQAVQEADKPAAPPPPPPPPPLPPSRTASTTAPPPPPPPPRCWTFVILHHLRQLPHSPETLQPLYPPSLPTCSWTAHTVPTPLRGRAPPLHRLPAPCHPGSTPTTAPQGSTHDQ
ncbi:MAG: hypothetical protein FRX49_13477 [Trebouxia sp. A1-2]|nr:MAG: hypothetical protein FRX49_13477 [Trebouxia sp. A1-2]